MNQEAATSQSRVFFSNTWPVQFTSHSIQPDDQIFLNTLPENKSRQIPSGVETGGMMQVGSTSNQSVASRLIMTSVLPSPNAQKGPMVQNLNDQPSLHVSPGGQNTIEIGSHHCTAFHTPKRKTKVDTNMIMPLDVPPLSAPPYVTNCKFYFIL